MLWTCKQLSFILFWYCEVPEIELVTSWLKGCVMGYHGPRAIINKNLNRKMVVCTDFIFITKTIKWFIVTQFRIWDTELASFIGF